MKEQNRIVLFANQKGGVGKSTLCMMFANYLSAQDEAVAVLDADIQQTIYQQRADELADNPGKGVPWDVVSVDITDSDNVRSVLESAKEFPGTILIDAPGNISDDNLLPIYQNADYIICPITYHPNVINSTAKFCQVMAQMQDALNIKFVTWFVPNMIDDRRTKDLAALRENASEKLEEPHYGKILTRINNRAWLERTSTLSLDSHQQGAVAFAFQRIIDEIEKIEK